MNRTLLRSKQANVDTKPELQIHHDDVTCFHGATIGQLDPQELFCLQSRGIAREAARSMLAKAFVTDLADQQPSRRQQEQVMRTIHTFFKTA